MGSLASPANLFERAVQCHRAGRTIEARALYEKVLAEDPDHHAALFSLSTLALQADHEEAAADLLARAIELAPYNASYHTNLGEIRRRLGLYQEAAESLVRALAIQPDLPEATYNLAVVLEENKELDPAIGYYERAADLRPDTYVFQRALAHALSQRGDLERAAGHFACAATLDPRSFDVLGRLATTLGLLGRSAGAAAAARRTLALKPDHSAAHQVLGAWSMEQSRPVDAIASFRRALEIDPALAAARAGLEEALATSERGSQSVEPRARPAEPRPGGRAATKKKTRDTRAQAIERAREHERAGRVPSAVASYRQALGVDPDDETSLCALGRLALQSNDLVAAVEWLARAVAVAPASASCRSDLGEAYRRLGRDEEAARALKQALALEPDLAEASHRLGLALAQLGDTGASIECLARAAEMEPGVFDFQFALAGALREHNAFERAVAHYHCALAIAPRRADVLVDLGTVLRRLGRLDAAIATCDRALALDPDCVAALAHRGAALGDQWRIDEAVASCRRALALDPDDAGAHFHLGNALVGAGRVDEAIASWRRTIALDPKNHIAHSNLAWMVSYSPRYDGEAILAEARAWSNLHAQPLAGRMRAHVNDRTPDRRLRIGYVSADFCDHSAAYFLVPLFRHHDRERFEIHAYSSAARADAITDRLRGQVDVWHDIERVGDLSAAELVREDRIDVLVDLAMHTGRGRPRLFACKPAPVQIAWLAYAGTTGLSTMDYRVTDPFLDPPGHGAGPYSEVSLTLPETFWCYDPLGSEPEPGSLPALRAGHVTFGCQNSFHKINAGVLALWARVLSAVEDSRLILHAPDHAHAGVIEELARHGIARGRVQLVPRRRRSEYLKTYQEIDIGLDTLPFNGATTSLDAFWMGVPVVTLVGSTVVGRAGRCLAMNLGLPELVANTPEDFERATVALARDLERLAALRSGLRARIAASPLMDAPRFARNLEEAYRKAWRAWCGVPSEGGTLVMPMELRGQQGSDSHQR